MILTYDPDEVSGDKWYAYTDNRDYDASGRTPMDAVCGLVKVLEEELNT